MMNKLRRKLDVSLSPRPQRPLPESAVLESELKESLWSKIKKRLTWGKVKAPLEYRTVWVGHRHPPRSDSSLEGVKPPKYPSNLIKTSKYTLWNFLPKNLFEQFRRLANFYFLIIAIIQVTLPNSPVSPMTSVLPLIFVVGVTAIKQGYEDYLRHKSDRAVNNKEVIVLKNGQEERVKSKNIKVGDILKVEINKEFPCDLVMLSSKEENGQCYITTANLDGETNLKIRNCVSETKGLSSPESFDRFRAVINCELPNPDLYRFKGQLEIYSGEMCQATKCPLGQENVLLRGTSLKNTDFVYGCAIFTGQETKLAKNSRMTSNKFSTIERSLNIYLIIFLLLLVVEVALCAALQYGYHSNSLVPLPWYLYIPPDELTGILHVLENVLSYIVLLNYTIPISMYVSVELQKFLGSLFFGWDVQLYDEATNQCAKCNTSDLNEELGQVQYLFTDKTGTLTENDMQFRQCSINGSCYIERAGHLSPIELDQELDDDNQSVELLMELNEDIENFLFALALCHTAQIAPHVTRTGSIYHTVGSVKRKIGTVNSAFNGDSTDPDSCSKHSIDTRSSGSSDEEQLPQQQYPEYQASSPDEKALLEACCRFGVVFQGIRDNCYHIKYKGRKIVCELLSVLEFDSDRKCMSVIVRQPDGQIYLYCKGAETALLPRADSGPVRETLAHVNKYAMLGLRTLVVGRRKLTDVELEQFQVSIRKARSSLEDRDKEIAVVFESVERNLEVIGATAVEDRLQDGVSETLDALRRAGIKIWMLTGDKEETAVNIGFSCGHFSRDMELLFLTNQPDSDNAVLTMEDLNKRILDNQKLNSSKDLALVVDGISLAWVFQSGSIQLFQTISSECKAVICCRMTPMQKAQIVRLIKKSPSKPTTAAIGDGANDVSMIQEAHVGLGVMGKEGRQAVRCSDFAFARFRFLKRVLLIHGHYYYVRVAMMVQYSFYKNLAFITPQLYYIFYAWFSPQPLYDSMFLTFYNILFTSLPIIIFGLFEQNISQDMLMDQPELYKTITQNKLLSYYEFSKWTFLGFWHSIVFFYGGVLLFNSEVLTPYGWTFDMCCLGTLVYHASIVIINTKLCLETRYFSGIFFFSIILSVLGFMGLAVVYCSSTIWKIFAGGTGMLWVYLQLLSSGSFWFCSILMIVVALVPDMVINVLTVHWHELSKVINGVR